MRIVIMLICQLLIIMFTLSQELTEPVIKTGFPIELPGGIYSGLTSAQFYDFDNDGKLEIVFVTNVSVYIIRNDGNNFPGWPKHTPSLTFLSEPAIGDLDGDGEKEIIVTSFGEYGGFLYAWHCDGTSVQGFPVIFPYWAKGWMLGPTLFDINGDNKLEIFIKIAEKVFGYQNNGNLLPGWPQQVMYGRCSSSPRIADIDLDGIPEIIISSTKIESSDTLFSINVFQPDGTIKVGWPFNKKNEYLSANQLGVIGNFTNKEYKAIAFATSRYPPIEDLYCYVLNPGGDIEPGWPQKMVRGLNFNGGLSMIDLSGEYDINVLIAGDKWGYIFTWNNFGNLLPKFPYKLPPPIGGLFYPGITSVPIPYFDIENKKFVVFTSSDIAKNDTGYLYASPSDSAQMPWSPIKTIGYTSSTPAFADLENDGSVELVILTKTPFSYRQLLYVWEFPGIPFDKQRFPWPVGSGNRWNTCEFGFEPSDTVIVSVKNEEGLPTKTQLYQNYPNPFNASTRIKYDIDRNIKVKLSVHNILGQEVAVLVDAVQRAGTYEAVWDARKYPSGVYYAKMESDNYKSVQKLIMIK